jgi:hypothetical protein
MKKKKPPGAYTSVKDRRIHDLFVDCDGVHTPQMEAEADAIIARETERIQNDRKNARLQSTPPHNDFYHG